MADEKTPFHNPFAAALRDLRGTAPADPHPQETVVHDVPSAPEAKGRSIPRAVVRMERSGRGGKEVTVVEQLPLNAVERDAWLRAFKESLGCGGVVEGDTLVLQGDQRKRLPALLQARGVKKVTVA